MVDPFGDWEACYDSNGNEVGGSGGVNPGICNSLTTGSYSWLSAPDGCGGVQATGNGAGFSCTGANGQTVNLGPSGQQGRSGESGLTSSDNVNDLAQANGQFNRLNGNAASIFGTDNYSLDPTTCDLIGGHCNFAFDCSDWSVCGPGRYDDGLHVPCLGGGYQCASGPLWVHDDTVSPWTGQFTFGAVFTPSFWEHGFVDLIGGTFFVNAFPR